MRMKKTGLKGYWLFFVVAIVFTAIVSVSVTKVFLKPETIVEERIVWKNRTIVETVEVPVYHNQTIIKYLTPTRELCSEFIQEALNESNCTLINHTNIRDFITDEDCALYCRDGKKLEVIEGDTKTVDNETFVYHTFSNYIDCSKYCNVGAKYCSCWVKQE